MGVFRGSFLGQNPGLGHRPLGVLKRAGNSPAPHRETGLDAPGHHGIDSNSVRAEGAVDFQGRFRRSPWALIGPGPLGAMIALHVSDSITSPSESWVPSAPSGTQNSGKSVLHLQKVHAPTLPGYPRFQRPVRCVRRHPVTAMHQVPVPATENVRPDAPAALPALGRAYFEQMIRSHSVVKPNPQQVNSSLPPDSDSRPHSCGLHRQPDFSRPVVATRHPERAHQTEIRCNRDETLLVRKH